MSIGMDKLAKAKEFALDYSIDILLFIFLVDPSVNDRICHLVCVDCMVVVIFDIDLEKKTFTLFSWPVVGRWIGRHGGLFAK